MFKSPYSTLDIKLLKELFREFLRNLNDIAGWFLNELDGILDREMKEIEKSLL